MSAETKIEWADSTFNPWIGCTKVSPACDHCYAAVSTPARALGVVWGPKEERRRTGAANWKLPIRWNDREFFQCGKCGLRSEGRPYMDFGPNGGAGDHGAECPGCDSRDMEPVRRRVFCASLADVFDNQVPVQWRRDLFDLIEATPNLDWLLLTKRIGNARSLYGGAYLDSARPWPANVWIGATICNQEEADRDIPKLIAVPAAKRFLSIEPLLGPISLEGLFASERVNDGTNALEVLDWVIVGGESGPEARPMYPDWARDLRDQCAAAGVAFLFKQWGEWTPGENVQRQRGTIDTAFLHDDGWHVYPLNLATDGGHIDDQPDLYRVGKKAAGRHLDGVEHNGFPA